MLSWSQKFEAEMVGQSHNMKVLPPISDEDFEKLMAQLPKKDIENFIADVKKLFKIMTNTVLVEKTIAILDNVVETMKKKPNVYPQKEVDGILLGKAILEDGFALFSKYDEPTKQLMVDVIYKNEIWYANSVYDRWS